MRDDEFWENYPVIDLDEDEDEDERKAGNDGTSASQTGLVEKIKSKVWSFTSSKPSKEDIITLVLVASALVCLAIPFFTNFKLVLNGETDDSATCKRLFVGMNVYLDDEVVGNVTKVKIGKRQAVLELVHGLVVPLDSRFMISDQENLKRIVIKPGKDEDFLRKGYEVKLELEKERVESKESKESSKRTGFVDSIKRVVQKNGKSESTVQKVDDEAQAPKEEDTTKPTPIESILNKNSIGKILQFIGGCTIFALCVAAVIFFRGIKWLSGIFKLCAAVSSLGILRWIPDIASFFKHCF